MRSPITIVDTHTPRLTRNGDVAPGLIQRLQGSLDIEMRAAEVSMQRRKPGKEARPDLGEFTVADLDYADSQALTDASLLGVNVVARASVEEADEFEEGSKLVLKGPASEGHLKFLVQAETECRQNLLQWAADFPEDAEHFWIEPFVNTPTDRATSLRVVVGADQRLYGAGLLHSAVDIGGPRKSRTTDKYQEAAMLDGFQDNAGPYYLGEQYEFRSNLALGGRVIGLSHDHYKSPKQKAMTPTGEQVLNAYGITERQVPEGTAHAAQLLARELGPRIGLYFAVDFLRDEALTEDMICDINPFPALRTVQASNTKLGRYAPVPFASEMLITRYVIMGLKDSI